VLCGWEGNRRSVVTLTMRLRLCSLSTYGLSALRKGIEHPAYTPLRSMAPSVRYIFILPEEWSSWMLAIGSLSSC